MVFVTKLTGDCVEGATTMRHATHGVFVVMLQPFVFTKHVIKSDDQELAFFCVFVFFVASHRRSVHRSTLNSEGERPSVCLLPSQTEPGPGLKL